MRILIHTINYRPELTGVGKYTAEMCEWLAARGHQVTVVAPPPYYPQWQVFPPYRAWSYNSETIDKVRVRRAPIWMPKRPGGLARVLYALSFALSSFPLVLREALRADMVFVIEPSFLNSPVAWIAARLARARAWLHIQDFEIDLAYDLKQLQRGRWLARVIESWVSRRFDIVSSISRRMIRRAEAKGVKPERLFLLPNFFDCDTIYPIGGVSPLRTQLGIDSRSVVGLYSGSLGAKQGIEVILESAKILQDAPVHFIICGEGVAASALRERAAGASNITFLPLQPAADLNSLLNTADVHLLPQRQGAAESVLPSKLIGMLASGRPVIAMAARQSEVAHLISGCGIRVDHGDAEAFARSIRKLADHPAERRRMGEEARLRALSQFTQDDVLQQFEARLVASSAKRKPARAERKLGRASEQFRA
ncbi:MAG TPA: WcaI family glycosyltransferase [Bryobacteraceae bacterium]|nr:WcaI family glycosyltransferase [Bryobacteraceae bacterium]